MNNINFGAAYYPPFTPIKDKKIFKKGVEEGKKVVDDFFRRDAVIENAEKKVENKVAQLVDKNLPSHEFFG